MTELELKYGCNPNQKPARIFMEEGELPIQVLNGKPGYINFLDAFNSWQLVKELKEATGLPAAASFKHVSPAGAAVGTPLTDVERKIYFAEDMELSPIACAYVRARGADRLCSYGDWAALSDVCDADTARYLALEVSDGVIAPGYTDEALAILKTKRKGGYNVVQIDPDYAPKAVEHKDVFGITFEQGRNSFAINEALLDNIVTDNKELPESAKRDMLIALITLKYTQSNSVCYVKDGQAIGVGAGQQSRIHCTRLAGNKADNWLLRQHPKVLGLSFVDGIRRPDRDNAIDVYLSDEYEDVLADGVWQNTFKIRPEVLTAEEKGVDRPPVGRDRGLRRLLPLRRQCGACPQERRTVHRPARRLHPGRPCHRHLQQVRHRHGLYRDAAVPPLMEAHRYGLSAAALKYLAALFMLVDHIGMVFPTMLTELGLPTWADGLPRLIGRLAFPIFAYFVAEGCRRTRFFHRYLIRLGACALLSQAPFTLATGVWGGSVLLTFFLSAGAIYGYERLSKAEHGPAVSAIPLFAACALALLLNVDYGFPAVLLIFALYLCGDNRRRKLLCLGAGLALLYLLYQPLIGLLSLPLFRPDWMAGYLLHALPVFALYALCAEASLLLLAWYRGQLGVQSKWFFYVFYPAHLLGLWALGLALN